MTEPFAIGYTDCMLHFSTRWSDEASVIEVDSIRVFILEGPEITERLSNEGWRLVRVHFGWESAGGTANEPLNGSALPLESVRQAMSLLPKIAPLPEPTPRQTQQSVQCLTHLISSRYEVGSARIKGHVRFFKYSFFSDSYATFMLSKPAY
jgi:hypothetical protein